MDLKILVREFLAKKMKCLTGELASKYGVPDEEVEPAVSDFLEETYGPAAELVDSLASSNRAAILFIGREDCPICKRTWPLVSGFTGGHDGLFLMKVDYNQPEGLLYHIIHQDDEGLLPMVALICGGDLKAVFTGETIAPGAFEDCYRGLEKECGQNIYAL